MRKNGTSVPRHFSNLIQSSLFIQGLLPLTFCIIGKFQLSTWFSPEMAPLRSFDFLRIHSLYCTRYISAVSERIFLRFSPFFSKCDIFIGFIFSFEKNGKKLRFFTKCRKVEFLAVKDVWFSTDCSILDKSAYGKSNGWIHHVKERENTHLPRPVTQDWLLKFVFFFISFISHRRRYSATVKADQNRTLKPEGTSRRKYHVKRHQIRNEWPEETYNRPEKMRRTLYSKLF